MSRIETEIWEPHPEKKGMVRYVGQRKTGDIFRDVEMFILRIHVLLRLEKLQEYNHFQMNLYFAEIGEILESRLAMRFLPF